MCIYKGLNKWIQNQPPNQIHPTQQKIYKKKPTDIVDAMHLQYSLIKGFGVEVAYHNDGSQMRYIRKQKFHVTEDIARGGYNPNRYYGRGATF